MGKIVDLQFNNAVYSGLPTFNGVGDVGAIRSGANCEGAATFLAVNAGGRASVATQTFSSRTVNALNILEGNLVSPTNPTAEIWFSNDKAMGAALSKWSARFIVSVPANGSISTANMNIIQGRDTASSKFACSNFTSAGWGGAGQTLTNNFSAGLSGLYRCEIQCDSTQTPSIVVRMYANNGSSQVAGGPTTGGTGGGTAADCNNVRLGDVFGSTGGLTWKYSEIEIWNTNNADGAFTSQWNSSAGGVSNSSYAGQARPETYSLPAEYSTPQDSITVTGGFTSHTDKAYGNKNRTLDLYIPNGPAPEGGFPLVIWAHSGFFVTGAKSDLVTHWRNRLLNEGYAVASIRYIRATLTNGSYSAWGSVDNQLGGTQTEGFGRYPSFIMDYKLAAARLRDKFSATGTSPLLNDQSKGFNGSKLIASGYSAGGFIALAAALSRDLTSDGTRSLKLSDNTTYNVIEDNTTNYTGDDPEFIGAFVYAAPISISTALDWDWTHNYTNVPTYWPPVAPTRHRR